MVKADVGDDAQDGPQDVGAVQPPAEARLNDGHVDCLLCEIEERQGRGNLEERGLQGFEERLLLFDECRDARLGYHCSVHADALAEVGDVGRGVKPHLEPCALQDGGQRVADAAFAVRASHVDGGIAAVGTAVVRVEG